MVGCTGLYADVNEDISKNTERLLAEGGFKIFYFVVLRTGQAFTWNNDYERLHQQRERGERRNEKTHGEVQDVQGKLCEEHQI